jgi:hypothetical protein
MESVDNKYGRKNHGSKFKKEIYSKVVRAGIRTYFFDVKSTRNEELFISITESKKRFSDHGRMEYEKHKIFLYPEDFEKFFDCFNEIIAFIDKNQPQIQSDGADEEMVIGEEGSDYTNVEFDEI